MKFIQILKEILKDTAKFAVLTKQADSALIGLNHRPIRKYFEVRLEIHPDQ